MSDTSEDLYQCVGICMADPDSGYCLGCGRPPLASPAVVAEAAPTSPPGIAGTADDDNNDKAR